MEVQYVKMKTAITQLYQKQPLNQRFFFVILQGLRNVKALNHRYPVKIY